MIIPLYIKYVFLNFLQGIFAKHDIYMWDRDLVKTKVIIADRNAFELDIAKSKPMITLIRGDFRWTNSTRGQNADNTTQYGNRGIKALASLDTNMSDWSKVKTYSDLIAGMVSINIFAKNGVVAETLADYIFTHLTAYKQELHEQGIYQISSISVSQENLVSQKAVPELIMVQVGVPYTMQVTVIRDERTYNCYVYSDTKEFLENIDFEVIEDGAKIKIFESTSEILKINYTDAITLAPMINVTLDPTAEENIFAIPDGGRIAEYYKKLKTLEVN